MCGKTNKIFPHVTIHVTKMIDLPNGNQCSKPAIYCKKKGKSPDAKLQWYIHYRFYCAEYPRPAGKLIKVTQKINTFEKVKDRLKYSAELRDEVELSLKRGYNPIRKGFVALAEFEIDPTTPLTKALSLAKDKVVLEPRTKQEIIYHLVHVDKAARRLRMDILPVQDIRKRHIKMLLEQIGKDKVSGGFQWSAYSFNTYRKYLSILFKELAELEAIDHNPITAISKQKTVKKIRQTLSADERTKIDAHLKKKYRRFWLFTHIFFHSGARETELLKVKGKDVNLEAQTFKVTIIKGSARREVLKPIKDVALPFWEEALTKPQRKGLTLPCGPDQYVFGYRMMPNDKPITAHQISRRWRSNVKLQLGIEADFYSLKHSHSDEIAAELGMVEAMRHNSHTSAGTTMTYTVNERSRKDERIKKIGNKLA